VFPELSLLWNTIGHSNSSSTLVTSTVPALRPRLTCKLYNSSQIRVGVQTHQIPFLNRLGVQLTEELCGKRGRDSSVEGHFEISSPPPDANVTVMEESMFALSSCSDGDGYSNIMRNLSSLPWCSDYVWAWGRWAGAKPVSRVERLVPPSISFPGEAESLTEPLIMFAPTPAEIQNTNTTPHSAERDFPEPSIFALSCNETIQTVDINVTFIVNDTDLDIDPAIPPLPDEMTARASALNNSLVI